MIELLQMRIQHIAILLCALLGAALALPACSGCGKRGGAGADGDTDSRRRSPGDSDDGAAGDADTGADGDGDVDTDGDGDGDVDGDGDMDGDTDGDTDGDRDRDRDTDGDGSYPARCDNYKCGYSAIGWKVIDDKECVFHADKALTWKGPSSFHINWSSSCCSLANQCSWGQNKYICLKKVQKAYNRWVNGQ